jgi:hypothetical protein
MGYTVKVGVRMKSMNILLICWTNMTKRWMMIRLNPKYYLELLPRLLNAEQEFLKKGVPIYVGGTHLQRLTDECIKFLIEVLFDKVLLLLIILCIIYTVIEDAIASYLL